MAHWLVTDADLEEGALGWKTRTSNIVRLNRSPQKPRALTSSLASGDRPATVRQSKTRTKVEYRSRAAQLENDETTKTRLSTPPRSLIYDVRYVNIFMKVVLTTSMTPYENVVLY